MAHASVQMQGERGDQVPAGDCCSEDGYISIAEEDRMEAHRDKPATQSVSAAAFAGGVSGASDQGTVVEVRMTACGAALMGIKWNLEKASSDGL